MTASGNFTIDELARASGTTVRSLRVYHERGVLPPPEVRGRTGFYGPAHLNRVRTISRLLDRGIKLNGIRELLAAWDRGDDLGDVLGETGPGRVSDAAGLVPDEVVAATDLEKRYATVPNGLARIVSAGLYEPVDATSYRPADRQLLRVAEQLAEIGMSDEEVLAELERLRADCDRIARRFAERFGRTVWTEFSDSEPDPERLAEITAKIHALRVIPGRVVAELVSRQVVTHLDIDSELVQSSAQR